MRTRKRSGLLYRIPPLDRVLLPVGWLALGIYLATTGAGLEAVGVDDPFGPGGFPLMIGGSLVVLGLWLGGKEVYSHARAHPSRATAQSGTLANVSAVAETEPDESAAGNGRPFAVVGVTILYLFGLSYVGFLYATPVAASLITFITARHFSWSLNVLFPVTVTGVLYAIFELLIGIRLP